MKWLEIRDDATLKALRRNILTGCKLQQFNTPDEEVALLHMTPSLFLSWTHTLSHRHSHTLSL